MDFVAGYDYGPLVASSQADDLAMTAHVPQRGIEIIDLIERFDLLLVAEKDIGMVSDQHLKRVAVPIDAERVG